MFARERSEEAHLSVGGCVLDRSEDERNKSSLFPAAKTRPAREANSNVDDYDMDSDDDDDGDDSVDSGQVSGRVRANQVD